MRLQRLICSTFTAGVVLSSSLLQAQPSPGPLEQPGGQGAGQTSDEGRPNPRGGQGRTGRPAAGAVRGLPATPLLMALDTDRNGELSAAEITNAAAALKALDQNRDGRLTRDEMMPGAAQPSGEGVAADGAQAINPEIMVQQLVMRTLQMDRDGDGQLSRDEIPLQLRNVVARFDADQDGSLDRAELILMAQQQVAMMTRGGRGQAGQGQPGQAQPGQGQPNQAQPGQGQGGQGQPEQGQPGGTGPRGAAEQRDTAPARGEGNRRPQ